MKNVLILGSSGQIGAHLTTFLKNKGYEVREFDIVRDEKEDLTIHKNYQLETAIFKSDFVFFLAFDVGGSRYLKKYQHTFDFIHNNSRIMVNVFDLLEKYKKPFIFASSQMSNMAYSPYGSLKNLGELYTKALKGLIVKFWNVYGLERDHEKSHVITDFILKGYTTGVIDMLTDGTEEREFLYAEDCCEALEIIMNNYRDFNSDDNLHITAFRSTKIIDIAHIISGQFNLIGKEVDVQPSQEKDTVQFDKKNRPDTFIMKWWQPRTSIEEGIKQIFNEMKNDF
jgi:nucleoside-diphosphate-sugar epimerase